MYVLYSILPLLQAIFVASASPEIFLGQTKVVGIDVPTLSQEFFGGIPYAEAPVGDLRLAPPVLKTTPGTDIFNATAFGKACFQANVAATLLSEDCLSIKVFRPSNISSSSKLPVFFWTHGSGFRKSSSATVNASAMVAQSINRGTPVIFVSINYRLGPLGWPQGAEADAKGLLNLGLRDQIAGLEWVQHNIEAFGGDKNKVTIGGSSAGSIMSTTLFLHPFVTNLARAAIFQSGFPGTYALFNATVEQDSWDSFLSGVASCQNITSDAISCLRSANSSDILEGVANATANARAFGPTLDGPNGFYPNLPSTMLANGPIVNLPFIAGQNKDDDPTLNYTPTLIALGLQQEFSPPALSEDVVNSLLTLYPNIPALGCPFDTGNETFGLAPGYKEVAALATDIPFTSQRRFWTQVAANSSVNAYGYYFAQGTSSTAPQLGVAHGDQVAYSFGTLSSMNETDPSAFFLSEVMIDYFVSFIVDLSPNDGQGVSRPEWPQYAINNQMLMQLNGSNLTTISDDFRAEQISYITSQVAAFHQ
ncbi:hypothetical protein GYMLUDRAFT_177894 [Collybiopsis luxurians FD-317 M1]|uniref:Carboxylic ester hydrolase n=1 Tax=Collybiopsis luxurians FD-317 M1 TaxID=944289 RepID=A0A0D0AU99_9AGAR|nr:hypothetical protein GYMLUDRAFT_177894 [Collybiopsis luxurians FD-317 M1]